MLYILLVDTTGDLAVDFVSLMKNEEINLMAGVAANAVELTSVLLDAISQIDLVGSDID